MDIKYFVCRIILCFIFLFNKNNIKMSELIFTTTKTNIEGLGPYFFDYSYLFLKKNWSLTDPYLIFLDLS